MEFWNAVGYLDSPVGVVDQAMMPAAERNAVCEAGGSSISPMDNMVNVAPTGRYRTPGESAPTIPDDHRAADRGRYRSAGASDVQRLTSSTQHHWDDLGVAGDAAGDLGIDRTAQR